MRNFFCILFTTFILLPYLSFAGQNDAGKKDSKLVNDNFGTEFWFGLPTFYLTGVTPDFVTINVISQGEVNVEVSIESKSFLERKTTTPNEICTFSIPASVALSGVRDSPTQVITKSLYPKAGIRVKSDGLIKVFVVMELGSGNQNKRGVFLCHPVTGLGMEYVAMAYEEDPMFKAVWNATWSSSISITAVEDSTLVNFTMGGNNYSETSTGLKPGQSIDTILNRGDVWVQQTNSNGTNMDISGSKVVSSKPVSIVSANENANIPIGNQYGDLIIEMETPTCTWGNHYLMFQDKRRKFPALIRVAAKEKYTDIFRNGHKISEVRTCGGVIGKGYQEMRMGPYIQNANQIATFSGDKPIKVRYYNNGIQEDGSPLFENSGPFMIDCLPIEQFSKEIYFCRPKLADGSNFYENRLCLVYQSDHNGYVPGSMMLTRYTKDGPVEMPFREMFAWRDTLFSYNPGGHYYATQIVDLPDADVFKITADDPFMVYIFGGDGYSGYGFSAANPLLNLFSADTVPPLPVWTMNEDGDVLNAYTIDYPEDDSIRSNMSSIHLVTDSSYNYDLIYDEFTPGVSRRIDWELDVIDKKKNARAYLIFTDKAGNSSFVDARYIFDSVEVEPVFIDFGKVYPDSLIEGKVKFINRNDQSILLHSYSLKNNDQGFNKEDIFTEIDLASDESCTTTVGFVSGEFGVHTDTLVIHYREGLEKYVVLRAEVIDPSGIGYSPVSRMEIYPSPAGTSGAMLDFSIESYGKVIIEMYDSRGNLIGKIQDSYLNSGSYQVKIPTISLSSGVYFVRLKAGRADKTIPIIINK